MPWLSPTPTLTSDTVYLQGVCTMASAVRNVIAIGEKRNLLRTSGRFESSAYAADLIGISDNHLTIDGCLIVARGPLTGINAEPGASSGLVSRHAHANLIFALLRHV